MLKIKEAIIVEGRYDQNTLSQLVDTLIIPTQGFGIFKDKDKAAMLRRVAEKRGVIVLTDSDGAGFVIRNHLKGILPPDKVKHAYIPDLYGKEHRKRSHSAEGKRNSEIQYMKSACGCHRAEHGNMLDCERRHSERKKRLLLRTDVRSVKKNIADHSEDKPEKHYKSRLPGRF